MPASYVSRRVASVGIRGHFLVDELGSGGAARYCQRLFFDDIGILTVSKSYLQKRVTWG
jgi:hypothetical protein